MNRIILYIALMLGSMLGYSQNEEIQTVFSRKSSAERTYGGYGAPSIKGTQFNNTTGIIIGGQGAVLVDRKFSFGGIGMAFVGNTSFSGDNLDGNNNASLDLNLGAGGLFVEYVVQLRRPVHFSIPVNVMAGGVSVMENGDKTESSAIFILEPGINMEFNFSRYFIPALNVSYRQVFGSSLVNATNQSLSGINVGLIFKFGKF